MAGRMFNFTEDFRCVSDIKGNVNGKDFTIKGEALGNASTGLQKGTYTCTSGELPMAWAPLMSTFQYGFKVFVKSAEKLNFHTQAIYKTGGYTMVRKLRFVEDGTITGKHHIYMKDGYLMSDVEIDAQGFKPDSLVLDNTGNGLIAKRDSEQIQVPHGKGIHCITCHTYVAGNGQNVMAILESTDMSDGGAGDFEVDDLSVHDISVKQTITGNTCYQEAYHTARKATDFMRDTAFRLELDGECDGSKFTVVGNGSGNGNTGKSRGSYTCTSGNLTLPWDAIAPFLQQGFKMFMSVPENVSNFYIECMKTGGYTMDREMEFVNDTRTITASHNIRLEGGVVKNTVTMKAKGFKGNNSELGNINNHMDCRGMINNQLRDVGVCTLTNHTFASVDGKAPTLSMLISTDKPFEGVVVPRPNYLQVDIACQQHMDGNSFVCEVDQVATVDTTGTNQ